MFRFGPKDKDAAGPGAPLPLEDIERYFLAEQFLAKLASTPESKAEVRLVLDNYRMAVTNLPVNPVVVQGALQDMVMALKALAPTPTDGADIARAITSYSTPRGMLQETTKTGRTSYLDKSCYVQTQMQCVAPGLFIGSYHPASNKELLTYNRITHICCCINVGPRFPNDFAFISLPADDSPEYDMSQHFGVTYKFIDECISNGGGVLVHCGAGISRAPTILAAYLMRKLSIRAVPAVQMIHDVRSCASPNRGFMEQLLKFEKECCKPVQ